MSQNKINVEVRIKPSVENIIDSFDQTLSVGTKKYKFHKVHITTTQRQLFNESVVPLLRQFINGYNCTVIAYGQTGSGKTYTMGISQNDTSGIVPQTLDFLFAKKVQLCCTFIEVYNEDVIDLLSDHKVPLSIREIRGDIHIAGATEIDIQCLQDGLDILKKGCTERTTKSTRMNLQSSRSHAIFTIYNRVELDGKQICSKFSFVDLAGSERLKRTMCVGERARESISINSGLLALGNVISALYKKHRHIPFRDSKLTRILQSCLNGHVLMVACISSAHSDINETHNTLKYANRAASIETTARANIEFDVSKMAGITLRREIQKLRNENQILKERIRRCDNANVEELMKENRRLKSKLENVEYENGIQEKSEDLAQEIVKNPFVQDLINNNEKLKEELKSLKESIAMSHEIEKTKKREVLQDVESIQSNISSCIHHSYDQEPLVQQKVSGDVEKSTLDVENNVNSSKTEKDVDITDMKISWTGKDKVKKRVTFEISPPKKKVSMWTPRKDRTLIDTQTVNKISGYMPHTMAFYDGKLIFSSSDNKVRMWSDTVSTLFTDVNVRCLEVSNVVYYTTRMILKLFDERSGIKPVYAYKNEISCLKKIGDYIYTGHEDGSLSCLDIRNMSCASDKIHNGTIFCLKKINEMLYTGSRDHSIKARRVEQRKGGLVTLSPPHYDSVHGLLEYKGDLISLSRDCSLKRWRASQIVKTVPNAHSSWIRCGAVLTDSFVTGSKNGTLRFWDFCDNSIFCVGSYKATGAVNCIATSGNGLFVGSQGKEIVHLRSDYKV